MLLLPLNVEPVWYLALLLAVFHEALQRERWRRDGPAGGWEVTMALKSNVWDVILSGIGIALAFGVHRWVT